MRPTRATIRLLSVLLAGAAPAALAATNPGDTAKFTLDHLNFVGNQRVSTDTLNSVVGIQPGDKVDRDAIVTGFNNIVAEYKKDNVGGSIQPTISPPHHGHIDVTFNITEEAPQAAKVVQPVLDHETLHRQREGGHRPAGPRPDHETRPGCDT